MNEKSTIAKHDPKKIEAFLEVIQRNIKQAIWKYEDFPGKEQMDYRNFDPAELDHVKNAAMMWTGGKDSSIVLYCVRELFGGRVPMDVIYVDTGYHISELNKFKDKIAEEWDFKDNLIIGRSDEVLDVVDDGKVYVDDLPEHYKKRLEETGWKKDHFKIGENPACCHLLKTCAFQNALKEGGYKAVIESIRWDEQEERSTSKYLAQGSGWIDHVRIRPSLFLSYEETRQILFGDFGVPKNPLYDKGYTSLGCEPCTIIPETDEVERAGREAQKEEMMDRLQALGYHGGEKK